MRMSSLTDWAKMGEWTETGSKQKLNFCVHRKWTKVHKCVTVMYDPDWSKLVHLFSLCLLLFRLWTAMLQVLRLHRPLSERPGVYLRGLLHVSEWARSVVNLYQNNSLTLIQKQTLWRWCCCFSSNNFSYPVNFNVVRLNHRKPKSVNHDILTRGVVVLYVEHSWRLYEIINNLQNKVPIRQDVL